MQIYFLYCLLIIIISIPLQEPPYKLDPAQYLEYELIWSTVFNALQLSIYTYNISSKTIEIPIPAYMQTRWCHFYAKCTESRRDQLVFMKNNKTNNYMYKTTLFVSLLILLMTVLSNIVNENY